MLLLASYSVGLGVPFLLVGLGVTRFMGAFDWVKRRYTAIAVVSGSLMVVVGVLLFTGEFTRMRRAARRSVHPGHLSARPARMAPSVAWSS